MLSRKLSGRGRGQTALSKVWAPNKQNGQGVNGSLPADLSTVFAEMQDWEFDKFV